MKFETLKEKIVGALGSVERSTGKNSSLPIIESVLLEVNSSGLVFKATNLDIGVEAKAPAKVESEGQIVFSGKTLLSYLNNFKDDEVIKFSLENDLLKIISGKSKVSIKVSKTDDFPIIPRIQDGGTGSIDSGIIQEGFKAVLFACGVSSMKPELSSVYMYSLNNDLIWVATDSFRLAEKKIQTKQKVNNISVLIPFKNITEIIRILEKVEGDVEIKYNQHQISFTTKDFYIVSRVVDGVFPNYKQIIPTTVKSKAIVLKNDFMQALKTTNIFSDKFNNINIKISPKEKSLVISSKNNDIGDSVYAIDASIEGEEETLNFNHRYVSDVVLVIKQNSVSIELTGAGKPLVIKGSEDDSYLYIVMPMNK